MLLFSDPVQVQQVEVSNLVFSMLSSLSGLWDIKMSAEFVSIYTDLMFALFVIILQQMLASFN